MTSYLGAKINDETAMAVALEVARQGVGKVSPNPLVGAVLLSSDGTCLATGYHGQLGGPHAEAEVLDKVRDPQLLKGARLFVTLEPCSHQGRTPSCARRLATLPLAEVVFGVPDPSDLARGGAQILREAGLKVSTYQGKLKEALVELCEVFVHAAQSKETFVALKAASTLDGKLAHIGGASQWITGEESRQEAHYLRALYDAILVGSRTLTVDNPSLNVRHPDFENLKKKVVVLDGKGSVSSEFLENSHLLKAHRPEDIYWVVPPGKKPPMEGLQLLEVTLWPHQGFDLSQLKQKLFKAGCSSVLVEGGAHTVSQFLSHGQAQRLHLFIAPKILGADGLGWSEGLAGKDMESLLQLKKGRWQTLGQDSYFTGRF